MQIKITDYPVFIKVGYFHEERLRPQEVRLSIKVHFVPRQRVSDHLRHTVDYGKLLNIVDKTLVGKEVKLLETICDNLAAAVFRWNPLIQKTWIKVEKPTIPNGLNRGAKVSVANSYERTPYLGELSLDEGGLDVGDYSGRALKH